jgi:hypothetical protein
MKTETEIRTNLFQKLGIWLTVPGRRDERLKEHIRMLDWVLTGAEECRSIEEIVTEASTRKLPYGKYAAFK